MVEADLNLAKREKAMLDAGLQENTAGGKGKKQNAESRKQKVENRDLRPEGRS
jgi:hypothetical protein